MSSTAKIGISSNKNNRNSGEKVAAAATSGLASSSLSIFKTRQNLIVGVIAFVCIVAFSSIILTSEQEVINEEDSGKIKTINVGHQQEDQQEDQQHQKEDEQHEQHQQTCNSYCTLRSERIKKFNGYDLLNTKDLIQAVKKGREELINRLKIDYGETNYINMFTTENDEGNLDNNVGDGDRISMTSRARNLYIPANENESDDDYAGDSVERFKKNLMRKVLSVQKIILQREEKLKKNEECDCNNTKRSRGLSSNHKRSLKLRRKLEEEQENEDEFDDIYDDDDYNDDDDDEESHFDTNNPDYYAQFVYANGGHSSSAAHGNFHYESSPLVLEKNVKNIFKSIGINFIAREYGMGGTSSGSEIALCVDSIFGIDLDVLTWDFGMTDGRLYCKQYLYAFHMALQQSPNFPILFGLGVTGLITPPAAHFPAMVEAARVNHIPFIFSNRTIMEQVIDAIPDTFGLTDDQIKQMPTYIRAYRCGTEFEKGEPFCDVEKFNQTMCTTRKFRTSWHPGWKMHALQGNLLSLFYTEVLLDAIKAIDAIVSSDKASVNNSSNTEGYYSQIDTLNNELLSQEYDYKFRESNVSETHLFQKDFKACLVQADLPSTQEEFDAADLSKIIALSSLIYKSRSFCHTARLPAEIRYLGLLTEDTSSTPTRTEVTYNDDGSLTIAEKGGPINSADSFSNDELFASYDEGSFVDPGAYEPDEEKLNDDDSSLSLRFDGSDRQECPLILNIDFKDFFFLHYKDGWASIILPNDAEAKYYGMKTLKKQDDSSNIPASSYSLSRPNYQFKGMVILCFVGCPWGKCPAGNIDSKNIFASNDDAAIPDAIDIQINGEKAVDHTNLAEDCLALKKGKSEYTDTHYVEHHLFKPNDDGKFEIRMKANEPDSFTRISSFVIL